MSAANYDRVERALRRLNCDIGAAECHGMLCGMLSASRAFARDAWLRHVSGGDDLAAWDGEAVRELFDELVADTVAGMGDDDYEFALLLPDDDAALGDRAAAFGAWCRGYLSGLGAAGIAVRRTLGEDARGFLADVERFGLLSVGDDADDDDERALLELTEFTRIGVLLLHAELQGTDDDSDDRPPATVH